MPPKRKRAEDAEQSTSTTRSTRSSTRQATTTDKSAPKKAAVKKTTKKAATVDISSDEETPPPKKPKKASTKTSSKKSAAKISNQNVDDVSNTPHAGHEKDKSSVNPEPYSSTNVQKLFKKYADPEKSDTIGAEGFGELCADGEIPMDGDLPLLLFWHLGAKELGVITLEEWTKGMEELRISSLHTLRIFLNDLHDLLLTDTPPNTKKDGEPYDRTHYNKYAADKTGAFNKFYMACFLLVKPGQSRNIDMETAVTFWSVLLAPQYPIMSEVTMFINEKGTYKAANKDVWSMMLEFCKTVGPNLDNYEAEGAWPSLLDDFVTWKQEKIAGDKTVQDERMDEDK